MSTGILRKLLNQPGIIRAPGAYDAWSARLVEKAGFPAVYMTGYGASASVLGQPDIGLMTMTEMVAQAKNMAAAIEVPLIADTDTGYGGIHNVMRAVREYEQAGIAAIQLEDQIFPKRCGHMEGKQVVSREEMVAKIKAAVYARRSEDFIIIARTDARAVNGLEDAIERSLAYIEAGAEIIFLEAPESLEEMQRIAKTISVPLMANMVEKGRTPLLSAKELEGIGYKIVIFPVSALYAATKSVLRLLERLKEEDTTKNCLQDMLDFSEFNELIGLNKLRDLERIFNEA